ncbi:MAG TPA: triphosphoribosyl-dephospho-CoA synthase MdcB [Burkholderiaceae bacterium]|jgi:triphosphoribosyl-dephospho-CoA synthase
MAAATMLSGPARAGAASPSPSAPSTRAQRVGRAAIAALYDELSLAPKPGLVSFDDAGSHADMDAATFMRSLFSLRHYFVRVAMFGAAGAGFDVLQAEGIAAEARMLAATGGVNTHRGAVFTLGLLSAAAGLAGGPVAPPQLRALLMATWGEALRARCGRAGPSHGQRAAQAHGLQGAAREAALGFPAVFELAWPALAAARASGLDRRRAHLQTLFEVIAALDDTNLAHRGGLAGLRHAQAEARAFLRAGGAGRPDACVHALAIHRGFVARRLSPGGAADVLAAACLLERVGVAA